MTNAAPEVARPNALPGWRVKLIAHTDHFESRAGSGAIMWRNQ